MSTYVQKGSWCWGQSICIYGGSFGVFANSILNIYLLIQGERAHCIYSTGNEEAERGIQENNSCKNIN